MHLINHNFSKLTLEEIESTNCYVPVKAIHCLKLLVKKISGPHGGNDTKHFKALKEKKE